MFFETAGIEVAPWIPPLVAFIISIFTSVGGVSGAFLLLPFQVSVLGFTNPSVSSTNQLYNIIAIPGGVIRYIKEGRMVWPLTLIVIAGTLPGVFIGAIIRIEYLPDPTAFKIFAGFVLLYIGLRMLLDLIKTHNNGKLNGAEEKFRELVKNWKNSEHHSTLQEELPKVKLIKFNLKKLEYEFYGESFTVSTPIIFFVSSIVGIVGGIYGIGGGAIMAPIFVALFHLPVYTVAGAALMGTFITSIAGVLYYQILSGFYPQFSVAPDWILGILFGIGGLAGIYTGATLQKYIPAKIIKWILMIIITTLSIKYIFFP